MNVLYFSNSDLNPTKDSGPVIIHASKCEKYGASPQTCPSAAGAALSGRGSGRVSTRPAWAVVGASFPEPCSVEPPPSKGAILEGIGGPGGRQLPSDVVVSLPGSCLLTPPVGALGAVGRTLARMAPASEEGARLWRSSRGCLCAHSWRGCGTGAGVAGEAPFPGCVLTAA